MDRRGFLSVSAATTAGVAVAGASSIWTAPSSVDLAGVPKGGGRALVAESVVARDLGGSLPFALARFAEMPNMVAAPKIAVTGREAVLSPIRDVSFRGFAAGAGALADDLLQIVAVHIAPDSTVMRHDLWSHAPKRLGGTSQSVLFTAHDNAFAGFEVTHTSATSGKGASAFFSFMASGSGPQLKPGVYVLAGPRAATGSPPELADYAFTGDVRAPVRQSRLNGLDFPYISFAVHGELI